MDIFWQDKNSGIAQSLTETKSNLALLCSYTFIIILFGP